MVPRLRSLCLEKVNNNIDEVDYQTIPKELARDLQLSKLFNGNFAYDDTFGLHQFGLDACALNIFYDGETWTFTYRSENNELYCYWIPTQARLFRQLGRVRWEPPTH